MDNAFSHRQDSPKSTSLTTATLDISGGRLFPEVEEGDEINGEPSFQQGSDPAVWAALSDNFRQVQTVLDRNRVLIQQVNENHRSKMHDNMVKNVALIQEINGNISKVVSS